MERARSIIILLFLIFYLEAEANYKEEIYIAYINGDMNKWRYVIELLLKSNDQSNEVQLELVNYSYGYIAWCLGNNKFNEAEKYLAFLKEKLENLEKNEYELSMIYSYWSAFYGFKIGLNKIKAPFLGPKSIKYAEMAIQKEKGNPFGYIQMGNSEFYRPEIFGGSKKKAIKNYLIAEKLMECDSDYTSNDWNYLNLLIAIAQAYIETKDYTSAKRYFEKILVIEPEFLWVKNELYPNFLKMINR